MRHALRSLFAVCAIASTLTWAFATVAQDAGAVVPSGGCSLDLTGSLATAGAFSGYTENTFPGETGDLIAFWPGSYTISCSGIDSGVILQATVSENGYTYGVPNESPTYSNITGPTGYASAIPSTFTAYFPGGPGCATSGGVTLCELTVATNSSWQVYWTTGNQPGTYDIYNSGWELDQGPVNSDALPGAPCYLTGFSGASYPNLDGTHVYPYELTVENEVDRVVAVDDTVTSGSTETFAGKSFYDSAVLADTNSGTFISNPIILGIDGTTDGSTDTGVVAPDWWCYGGSSYGWVNWGTSDALNNLFNGAPLTDIPGVTCGSGTTLGEAVACENGTDAPPSGDGGAFPLGECFSSQGMSLYDPVSWVTGLVKWGTCSVKWLLEPSSSTISNAEQTFGITSNAPTGSVPAAEWLGAMAKGVAAFPFAEAADIQTVADGGGCSLGLYTAGDTIDGHTLNTCDILTSLNSLPSAATAGISWVQVVLSAIIYMFAALLLFFVIRDMIAK